MSALTFEISCRSQSCRARLGRVSTPHGSFQTPAFMPVGTKASVKGLLPDQVAQSGAEILLGNTYHLMLRPGTELIEQLGGIHRFMNWPHPVLTDSGGFQVFSLGDLNKIDEDGVTFRSEVDGRHIRLTPESSIAAQNQIGADIIMAFDDCPPMPADQINPLLPAARKAVAGSDYAQRNAQAVERSIRWLGRCMRAHQRTGEQALFGIVQGGLDLDLRRRCAEKMAAMDLPGYAIGGVSVGEQGDQIDRIVGHTAAYLPEDRPRYLMGVGYERDIVQAVRAGMDMFDCVLPTRNGRNGRVFTRAGPMNLRNACYREDLRPVDQSCDCPCCRGFSRAYLRHLFLAGEMLGPILLSMHNLRHYQRLMLDIRSAIRDDAWPLFLDQWPVLQSIPAAEDADLKGSPDKSEQT